jgi:hypothetical protein
MDSLSPGAALAGHSRLDQQGHTTDKFEYNWAIRRKLVKNS